MSQDSGSLHAISFDVEEFFQVANLRGHFERDDWDAVESRLDVGMNAILRALESTGSRATMFFLGWVAERRPDWVRRCIDAGCEIASHGYEHLFLNDLGKDGLRKDLARTEDILVAAGAPKPIGFRASTFTLTRETWWAIDVLLERGYRYDSSIHPVRHPVYGIPDFDPCISIIRAPDDQGRQRELIEFPVSTYPFLGRNLPVGGGGYFRLLPGAIHRAAVASLERRNRPVALYMHPWEFDPEQPRYPAPALKRFRHYVGLSRSIPRLQLLLERFRFGTMQEVLRERGHLLDS
ncbi:MAG: polysaccharide deacetylase family protein (PEP-CTERM system associated) [Planctomycetota bacterium]|jgi:polysaccharide deacetylase family protein (PEP-CTERM system associated)